jgi:hypothetical protein
VSEPTPIEAALVALRARIADAARRAGRDPASVRIIGASKRVRASLVARAVRAGVGELGENYVQEARDKQPLVAAELAATATPAPRWHLIGRLQRNKLAQALRCFDVIETLDGEAQGDALDARAAGLGRRVAVLIQVNLSGEAHKGGVARERVAALLAHSVRWPQLDVVGLMTLPAPAADPEASRPAFRALRELCTELRARPGGGKLRELSMGMSGDFEVAVEEGATWVRIGTALFGARPDN